MPDHFVFDERFVEAFAHDEHRVLGWKLQPYSLWHEFNLQLIDSPILAGGEIGLKDLIAAVRICRTRYSSGCTTPTAALPRGLKRLAWLWRIHRSRLDEEVQKFGRYAQDYGTGPQYWPKTAATTEDGKVSGAANDRDIDELLEQAAWIWKNTGCDESYVWNMPLGAVRWYSPTFLKFTGAEVQIWTTTHEMMKKQADKLTAWRIAQRTAEMETKCSISKADAEAWVRRDHGDLVKSHNQQKPITAFRYEPRDKLIQARADDIRRKDGVKPEAALRQATNEYWHETQRAFRRKPPQPHNQSATK